MAKHAKKKAAAKRDNRPLLISVALVIAVFAIYAQCVNHQFTRLDDPDYVVDNERVNSGLSAANAGWAFTAIHASNWHPLTWISHMVDVQLFGLDAGKHVMTNVVLHAANTLLLFFLLRRATKRLWPGAIVAALFAVHPLHVESVAWVAERKDVLSTLFFLITLMLWTRFVQNESRTHYWLAVVAFAAGLMSKPMLVTTPFVLLLLDWWPFRRTMTKSLFIEKWPFFALTLGSILITLRAQQAAMGSYPFGYRIANSIVAYGTYLAHTIWPKNLAVIYPLPPDISATAVAISAAVLIAITGAAYVFRHRLPFLITGWLWFLGTLVPVIGLVQVGHASMADRYTYIPLIGIFIAMVWLGDMLLPSSAGRAVAAIAIVAMGATAYAQTKHWKNGVVLFERALAVTKHKNDRHVREGLGMELLRANEYGRAANELRLASQAAPREDGIRAALGTALMHTGDIGGAKREFEAAVSLNSKNATALRHLGDIALANGRPEEATELYTRSAAAKPDPSTLAILAASRGNFDEAIARYREAIARSPRQADIRTDLGTVLARAGRTAEAIIEYESAVRLDPNAYEARMSFGTLLARLGRDREAVTQLEHAASIRRESAEPHVYLALVYERMNRHDDAVRAATTAASVDATSANRILTNAIRIPFSETNLENWIAFVREKQGLGGAQGRN